MQYPLKTDGISFIAKAYANGSSQSFFYVSHILVILYAKLQQWSQKIAKKYHWTITEQRHDDQQPTWLRTSAASEVLINKQTFNIGHIKLEKNTIVFNERRSYQLFRRQAAVHMMELEIHKKIWLHSAWELQNKVTTSYGKLFHRRKARKSISIIPCVSFAQLNHKIAKNVLRRS